MASNDPFLDPLEGHAKAIGAVCIHWAWLEFIAESVMMQLMGMRVSDPTGHCVVVNCDIRSKLSIIKSIGFLKRPSDEWFNRLEALINRIDNEIRVDRNRVVHDIWRTEDDGATTRTQSVAMIIKPQAGRRELQSRKFVAQTDAEVMAVANEVRDASYALWELAKELPNFLESIAE